MSDQEQSSTETTVPSENLTEIANDNNQSSVPTEKSTESESNASEQRSTRRIAMPQDIRYATEPNDREKLMEKYNNYQISDTNACNIRFLTDNRQKKNLLGRNEDEDSNLHSLAKTFNVNMFPGYQHTIKHSYKIFGTEANVRQCVIEIMNRMFKRSNRATQRGSDQMSTQQTTSDGEKPQETEISTSKEDDDQSSHPTSKLVATINSDASITEETKTVLTTTSNSEETEAAAEKEKADDDDDGSSSHPTSIFVTTINPDSSVTEEKKSITPSTPNINEEKTDDSQETKTSHIEEEPLKFIPLERKPQYTFVMLISGQGQEVLKKNWTFFAGSLQQRLNVVVTNPVKLPKFGDKQIQNELSITGELIENLTDATLQIAAFINDVLGIPIQPYKVDEEPSSHDQRQNTDTHTHRSYPGQSSSSSSSGNHPDHPSLIRNRNGAYEQIILIRSDCVARIVGTRGSNLKRIQAKCRLRDIFVSRQANENGYVECTLATYQARNLRFAIDTIRSFLRNEDDSAVLVIEPNHGDNFSHNSPHLDELVRPNKDQSSSEQPQFNEETGFMTAPLNLGNNQSYPQPSYNFQNTPSFDFTHQATSASRKTDKRRGELHDHNKTPNESQNSQYETLPSSSPRHQSKRSCPVTKEIDCTTDDGFWIQKQHYQALDDISKQLFDSLIEKLEKIRIANEENAAKKQQRLVGRNRSNKSKAHPSSIPYLNEENNHDEKDLTIKATQIENNVKVDENDEKENNQEPSTIVVNQD